MALAVALGKAGYSIDALVSRRPAATRRKLAKLDVDCRVLAATDLHLLRTPTLIIATPDDEINSAVKSLLPSSRKASNGLVLHTSGALSSDVLAPLAKLGWHTGSFHPLVAVGDSKLKRDVFRDAYWCIEGDRVAKAFARKLVRDLEGHPFAVSAENKPLYHAAAVMASGDVVALFDVALELLQLCGIARKSARRIMAPLTESAVRNLVADPAHALTGPFARGDLATVALHLKALSRKSPEALELYRLLGRRSAQLSERKGLDKKNVTSLMKLLNQ